MQRFLLLYGSQTGQAQAIAEEIANQAPTHGLDADLLCLSLTEKRFWLERTECAVIVSSTTGDGDAPDTVLKFLRRLKKKTLASDLLADLSYTLLGLGDSNYSTFCACPKMIDKRLRDLGARTFYPQGWADDATGLEVVVDPWIDGLWPALRQHLGLPPEGSTGVDDGDVVPPPSPGVVGAGEEVGAGEGVEASLSRSCPPLSDGPLSLPLLPPRFLQFAYLPAQYLNVAALPIQNGCPFPSAASPVAAVTVVAASRLTHPDAVKTTLKLTLDVAGCGWEQHPGDSIGIVCENDESEVTTLLQRLGVTSDLVDCTCSVSLRDDTTKKKAAVPPYIPQMATLKHVFTRCLDLRFTPKKAFLRALVDHCRDPAQRRRLQELCSKQGADDFARFVREPALSLIHILEAFPDCRPPVDLVLEHLPRLQPRAYSIASANADRVDIVFNVVEMASVGGDQPRVGVCTGWLDRVTRPAQGSEVNGDVARELARLDLDGSVTKVPVFLRRACDFRPPRDLATPFIMIGPGTGVAPFIGFLQHRQKLIKKMELRRDDEEWDQVGEESGQDGEESGQVAESWLFFGCRHEKRDFIFRSSLEEFVASKTLAHLVVSFSRDSPPPGVATARYVQDNLRLHADQLAPLLMGRAIVYVCGDATNMARNVRSALVDILEQEGGMSALDADDHMTVMKRQDRYREDVWT